MLKCFFNVHNKLFWREEVKDNVCSIFFSPDVQLKRTKRQLVSQSVRNSIMATHIFHRSYGRNSLERKI